MWGSGSLNAQSQERWALRVTRWRPAPAPPGIKNLPYRREAPMSSAELYEHHERRMLLCEVRRHRSVRRTG
jgi:hypothetical protein